MKLRYGKCEQPGCTTPQGYCIAKTLPSSGNWCHACNQKRLDNMKPSFQKQALLKGVVENKKTSSIIKKLVQELDAVFSIFIRTRDIDERGFVKCCTCPAVLHWKDMHCGHLYSRGSFFIRWNVLNAHAQCSKCNLDSATEGRFKYHLVYAATRHGPKALVKLYNEKNTVIKLDRLKLAREIEDFKNLNNQNISHLL